jgi:hypothetical protein
MEIKIGSKVKHIPSGDIFTVDKINPMSYVSKNVNGWKQVRLQKNDCEIYIEPVKEKSFYEKMRDRNMEDAKALTPSPKEIGQHILWLKMAVIDRVERIENLKGEKIYTMKTGDSSDINSKFGFSEHYVNLLMHYAYEAGKKNATDSLASQFIQNTKLMKNAIESIVQALDENDLLPYNEDNNY